MIRMIRAAIPPMAIMACLAVSAWTAQYEVDPVHSNVMFQVRHMGISTVTGNFGDFQGSFQLDPDKPATAKGKLTIEAKSIDTDNEKRDNHLRSGDFFDVEKFPKIQFETEKITDVKGQRFTIHGNLIMRGISKSIALKAILNGVAKDMDGNQRIALSAEGMIDRTEWGLEWNKVLEAGALLVSDKVKIMIDLQGVAAKSEGQEVKKEAKAEVKDAKKEAKAEVKDAKEEAKAEVNDAKKEAKAGMKDAKMEVKAGVKDVKKEAKAGMKDAKMEAKSEAKDETKDAAASQAKETAE